MAAPLPASLQDFSSKWRRAFLIFVADPRGSQASGEASAGAIRRVEVGCDAHEPTRDRTDGTEAAIRKNSPVALARRSSAGRQPRACSITTFMPVRSKYVAIQHYSAPDSAASRRSEFGAKRLLRHPSRTGESMASFRPKSVRCSGSAWRRIRQALASPIAAEVWMP